MQHALIVRVSTFCVSVLLAVSSASAASPTVESVVPGVGPRGSPFSVVLTGGHLKDARELPFYGTGLTCLKLEAESDNELRATLEASAGCRLGAHPFRVRTPGGLSELKVVHVTRFPVVAEVEPNDDRKGAQAVPLNTTIAGVIDSGDVDSVSVVLEKGQRLSAEVQAIRLGGEMTDTQLAVFGPDGRPVALADDTPATRQDPFATLVAPVAGAYSIQIRDTNFGGGPVTPMPCMSATSPGHRASSRRAARPASRFGSSCRAFREARPLRSWSCRPTRALGGITIRRSLGGPPRRRRRSGSGPMRASRSPTPPKRPPLRPSRPSRASGRSPSTAPSGAGATRTSIGSWPEREK